MNPLKILFNIVANLFLIVTVIFIAVRDFKSVDIAARNTIAQYTQDCEHDACVHTLRQMSNKDKESQLDSLK